ncbi:MAG TPA: outer membrane beta-barrel domain-containing protein [Gammaproteobacteria bacterium]|nr:outer membrane beta-barrel domain-containing protein [Gammaproteobacteria bacterium]
MESRFLVLFLMAITALGLGACSRQRAVAADESGQPPVIEPEVHRREIEQARIDTEDFEVGVYAGQLSVEDFGVNSVVGAHFTYHVTEGFFVDVSGGRSDTERTSFERLSGAAQLLTDSEREYSYYNLSLGYNILPGESFIGRNRALNTALYVIGGVGKTDFAGDDRFTLNVGIGFRLMPLDWLAVHADLRDYIYDIDLLGQEKTSHNLEARIGVSFFF